MKIGSDQRDCPSFIPTCSGRPRDYGGIGTLERTWHALVLPSPLAHHRRSKFPGTVGDVPRVSHDVLKQGPLPQITTPNSFAIRCKTAMMCSGPELPQGKLSPSCYLGCRVFILLFGAGLIRPGSSKDVPSERNRGRELGIQSNGLTCQP
jgi:hypothetical protein